MNSLRTLLKKREMTSFFFLILLFAVVGCINPAFLAVSNIAACFNSSVVFVIISVGMAFTIMVGEIDVSVGSCLGMTAVVVGSMICNGASWAVAFAVGILTSILVRGIGTAWQIGWESTWFAESPEAVRAIIRFTYGLIPLDIIGLAPIPDTDAIAALRFDLDNAVGAAPWLCRLMALLFCVVILPRLLLAGWVTYRMQLAQKRITVKTDSPYYRGILTVKPLLPLWTGFIIDSADEAILSSDKWRTFEKAFRSTSPDQSFNTIVCNAWEASPETVLKSIPEAEAYRLMLVLDPMNTPEDEVHGTLLSALSDWCSKTRSPSLTVILDCSTLNRRIGNNAARVALWETFISDRHAVTLSADFDNPESLQALQRSIRALHS